MHVLDSLGFAGMEQGVIRLVNGLSSNSFESVICVLRTMQLGVEKAVSPKVAIEVLGPSGAGFQPRSVIRLAKTIGRLQPDIIHSHNYGSYIYTAMARVMNNTGQFVHGEHGRESPEWRLSRAQRVFISGTKGRVNWFTTVAEHLVGDLSRTWGVGREKIVALQNGVDLARFHVDEPAAETRRSLGIEEGAYVIGTIANFRPVKDYETFFSAVSEVARRKPGVTVLIAGTHSSSDYVKQFIRNGIGACEPARAIFLGCRPDVERIVRAMNVYVNCSHYEGMSNTILEAMAGSCPVVATDVLGNREIFGNGINGHLFPPGDSSALAARISALRDNPGLSRQYVEEQLGRVRSTFSKEVSINRYAHFYMDVVNGQGAAEMCA
jgi:glycosyltransferase involved in cell wall biosynthesis